MKIVIHPTARKILITVFALSLFAILLLFLRAALFPRPALSEDGLTPDAQAAVEAVAAFYTLDYTASSELWIADVCAFSTDKGCQSIRSYFAPTIQALVQAKHIQTGCSVLPIRVVQADGDVRIWQVRVTLDHPWDGLDSRAQDVYAEVLKEQGRWHMNRILFQQEVEQFLTPNP